MKQIPNYVKPELLVVAVVLYFIGIGLKSAQAVKDKYIPLILGGAGIVLCAVWVLATCPISTRQEIADGSVHSNRARYFGSRVKHIYQSDD